MTAARTSHKVGKDGKTSRSQRGAITCKTCSSCRLKKIRCDGNRPQCSDCEAGGFACEYPRDARRDARPSQARVQSLESTLSLMIEHLKSSGIVIPNMPDAIDGERSQDAEVGDRSRTSKATIREPDAVDAFPTPPSLAATTPQNDASRHIETQGANDRVTYMLPSPNSTSAQSTAISVQPKKDWQSVEDTSQANDDSAANDMSMSYCEARVAGVFHEHGCVSSVHGLAGIMAPTWRERHKENISKLAWKGETAIAESRARLISNAALQRQREGHLTRQPQQTIDLDGLSGDVAKHLLDVHFNRTHYSSVMTYRPAIMDSLLNGGLWMNKLLLNALYYSSAPYSDWDCLRSRSDDTEQVGDHFYRRCKELMVDEIDQPSVPTAIALLLISGTLVSQGMSSAGWNLSGLAYRMIIDLGCHMVLGPGHTSDGTPGGGRRLHRDIEQEVRKRLYWGAYVTDATQALYLGRSCMFASVEARVPLQLLDTFEEMELWEPYTDKFSEQTTPLPAFEPQPARTVSNFMALARLLQISSRITELYGIQTIKLNGDTVQDKGRSIEWALENWRATLPAHLRLEPDSTSTPPPHQITPQYVHCN